MRRIYSVIFIKNMTISEYFIILKITQINCEQYAFYKNKIKNPKNPCNYQYIYSKNFEKCVDLE